MKSTHGGELSTRGGSWPAFSSSNELGDAGITLSLDESWSKWGFQQSALNSGALAAGRGDPTWKKISSAAPLFHIQHDFVGSHLGVTRGFSQPYHRRISCSVLLSRSSSTASLPSLTDHGTGTPNPPS